jgi:predicted DNA-binding transcriptional regulator YafY
MYHPTTRALAVLTLLQTHGRLTGADLARRLEVNVRTVRSYITMLQDLGAPIIADRGRDGAYTLEPGFKLPPMMFTGDEALALVVGLIAARQLGLDETSSAIESARAKLEQAMPPDLKGRTRALAETIQLDLDAPPAASPGQVMMMMSSGAQSQQRVHMRYRSGRGDETERDFDPYGLAYYRGCWYAVGRCGIRNDLRSFRLDRVLEAGLTGDHFDRPKHFDPLAHVVQAIATLPRKFNFEVLLKTDLATAQNEIVDVLGLLEPCPDGVLLRGSADDLDWLARQLAKSSFDFVIHEPEPLRAALQRRASQLARLAGVD